MKPLSLLTELLNHYSPSTQEGEAVDYLVSQMRALGMQAFIDEAGNAVGMLGDGPADVVLLGHIDTVTGVVPVRQEGDRLYGRGAVDAKGPLAAFVAAVAQAGPMAGRRFVVVGAVEEEAPSSRGGHFAVGQYRPACAIVGEPSGWDRVTLGYKGSAWAEVTVRRPLSHTADGIPSACEAAVDVWNRLQADCSQLNAGREKVFDHLSPTLRGMNSGDDGLESWAQLTVGFRLPPGTSVDELRTRLDSLAAETQVRWLGLPLPAYRAEKNTPLVRAFLGAIRASDGIPGFNLKSGTSDMNLAGPAWNCPIVAYGPGDSTLDHTPDEHVLVSEYLKAIDVLTAVLRSSQITS